VDLVISIEQMRAVCTKRDIVKLALHRTRAVSAEQGRDLPMGYYHTQESADEYIAMAEGYDGRELIEVLKKHLPPGSNVLELGMGPGKDLDLLSECFQATGSDVSPLFLDRYRAAHSDAKLLLLDAVTLDTTCTFDAIYSNKVLMHLTREELRVSLRRQAELLNDGGLLLHSFWYGDQEEEFSGLRFVQYTAASFAQVVSPAFEIVAAERYTEMDRDDSIYFLVRKRQ
jgi:cyclopropane fatty-acyl-phospholipid synthase-like methyltransferase